MVGEAGLEPGDLVLPKHVRCQLRHSPPSGHHRPPAVQRRGSEAARAGLAREGADGLVPTAWCFRRASR